MDIQKNFQIKISNFIFTILRIFKVMRKIFNSIQRFWPHFSPKAIARTTKKCVSFVVFCSDEKILQYFVEKVIFANVCSIELYKTQFKRLQWIEQYFFTLKSNINVKTF